MRCHGYAEKTFREQFFSDETYIFKLSVGVQTSADTRSLLNGFGRRRGHKFKFENVLGAIKQYGARDFEAGQNTDSNLFHAWRLIL